MILGELKISVDKPIDFSAGGKLRGFLGNIFKDNVLAHHHFKDGTLYYKYPYVQYKAIENNYFIIGIEEGIKILEDIFEKINNFIINYDLQLITNATLLKKEVDFSISDHQIVYDFLTPWCAFNEKNQKKYLRLYFPKTMELLKKILIGNILSIAKFLNYTVPGEIQVQKIQVREHNVKFKTINVKGFYGSFSVNFNIPDLLGIGKATSRGFGTIKQRQNNNNEILRSI